MLWEVVSNSLDEHLMGRARHIRVSVEGQLAEVEDDGGGISRAPWRNTGKSMLEVALTVLHAGGTLDDHRPHLHLELRGVGLAPVNALCESLEVEVRRDGSAWQQRYARGVPLGPLERIGPTSRTGTRVRFRADSSIFDRTAFNRDAIRRRLFELAAFNPKLTLELMGERIAEPRGFIGLVEGCKGFELSDPFTMRSDLDGVLVEVALAWCPLAIGRRAHLRSFLGQAVTKDGGTHVRGFRRALTAVLRDQPERRVGACHAVVHVNLQHPRFGNPTRDRLANPEVETIVYDRFLAAYREHLLRTDG
jgi:DNA gyrase subunit B